MDVLNGLSRLGEGLLRCQSVIGLDETIVPLNRCVDLEIKKEPREILACYRVMVIQDSLFHRLLEPLSPQRDWAMDLMERPSNPVA